MSIPQLTPPETPQQQTPSQPSPQLTPPTNHVQVPVTFMGMNIKVDAGMVEILQLLWSKKVITYNSCEDNSGRIWIQMQLNDFKRITRLAKRKNRDLYEFIENSDYGLIFDDDGYDEDTESSVIMPDISWRVSLRFDKSLKDEFIHLWKVTFPKSNNIPDFRKQTLMSMK